MGALIGTGTIALRACIDAVASVSVSPEMMEIRVGNTREVFRKSVPETSTRLTFTPIGNQPSEPL